MVICRANEQSLLLHIIHSIDTSASKFRINARRTRALRLEVVAEAEKFVRLTESQGQVQALGELDVLTGLDLLALVMQRAILSYLSSLLSLI